MTALTYTLLPIRESIFAPLVQLEDFVKDFNKEKEFFTFEFKSIADSEFTYLNTDILNSYELLLTDSEFIKNIKFSFNENDLRSSLHQDSESLNSLRSGKNQKFNDYIRHEISKQMCAHRFNYLKLDKMFKKNRR